MRIGVFCGGDRTTGTIDEVVDEARQAEADGFDTYWASQIFGHDALTALAVIGREVPRHRARHERRADVPAAPDDARPAGATTNQASGGRLCLGIGLSHQIVIESMIGHELRQAGPPPARVPQRARCR